jgi:predicted lipoprotein
MSLSLRLLNLFFVFRKMIQRKPSRKRNVFFLVACTFFICSSAYANDTRVVEISETMERLTADQNESAWREFNISTVEHFIIPSYKTLATANLNLNLSSQTLCNAIRSSDTEQFQTKLLHTKGAFHASMDAWQSIQNIYFGPIEIGMRHHSIQFWPDKKIISENNLKNLLMLKTSHH